MQRAFLVVTFAEPPSTGSPGYLAKGSTRQNLHIDARAVFWNVVATKTTKPPHSMTLSFLFFI